MALSGHARDSALQNCSQKVAQLRGSVITSTNPAMRRLGGAMRTEAKRRTSNVLTGPVSSLVDTVSQERARATSGPAERAGSCWHRRRALGPTDIQSPSSQRFLRFPEPWTHSFLQAASGRLPICLHPLGADGGQDLGLCTVLQEASFKRQASRHAWTCSAHLFTVRSALASSKASSGGPQLRMPHLMESFPCLLRSLCRLHRPACRSARNRESCARAPRHCHGRGTGP